MTPSPQGLGIIQENMPAAPTRLSCICGESFEGVVYESHGDFIFDPVECPSCGQVLNNIETRPYERGDNCVMDFQAAQIIVAKYACSNCWSHLVSYPFAADRTRVLCGRCGQETRGYVSKYYVEKRLQNSLGEKIDAAYALRDVIPSVHKGKPENQLLNELGF
jgi:hypothetical protein